MLEPGNGLGFGAETCKIGFASMAAQDKHFESDQSIEANLPSSIDDAHAPATEFLQDLIPGNHYGLELCRRTDCRYVRRQGDCLRRRIQRLCFWSDRSH